MYPRDRSAHGGGHHGPRGSLAHQRRRLPGLKYLGVAYLLFIAWRTLREKGALAVEEETVARSATNVIVSAILVNILNPKLTIFFFAFLPQFVSTNDPGALIRMVELSGVFMLITLVVFIGYGSFAAAIRKHVISRPQVGVRRSLVA